MANVKIYTHYAHARVNLIGEHTDYNGGWVLPTSMPQKTTVSLTKRSDFLVRAKSDKIPEIFEYQIGDEKPRKDWLDYLQGVTFLLRQMGVSLSSGFDIRITSNIPMGSGLSSSAALLVSFINTIKDAFQNEYPLLNSKLSPQSVALLAQKVENEFVGAQVGVMDPMACGLSQWGKALYLDTVTLDYEQITLPLDSMDLLVINSGISHQHANGDYNERRKECEEACAFLKIKSLREFSTKDLDVVSFLSKLPEKLQRRVRHVVRENNRVHQAVNALKNNDLNFLGKLFKESHQSMSQDYEVSIPEIDLLVDLANQQPEVYGARLTGGGFGGSIVAVSHKGKGTSVTEKIIRNYYEKTKLIATPLI